MKRYFLFFLTNIAVVITLSLVAHLFGIRPYLAHYGMDYEQLAIFCLFWGMGGAFISLQISRWSAKMMMGVELIDPNRPGPYVDLYQMVSRLSQSAGLPRTPEVGVYQSPEVNAFATGPSKGRALVAFSTGLLSRMNRNEIEGVAAHEIGHIANGDMVTMTLLQGVINAFVMFLSRVIAFAITATRTSDDEERATALTPLVTFLLEIVLAFLGMIVVGYFSRQREFRADAASAKLAGREKMIAALRNLQNAFENPATTPESGNGLASMKISGRSGILSLFSTHPPLEQRIRALESLR